MDVEDEKADISLDIDTDTQDFEFEESGDLQLDTEDLDAFALELEEDGEPDVETDAQEDDIDLDFDIEEDEAEETADISISEVDEAEEEGAQDGFGMGREEEEKTVPQAPKPAAPAFTTSLPIPKKKSKAPAILVVLLLLIGGAVGGYFYMGQQGMLPFVGKGGEIIPLEETFNHTFVENQNVGSLFIVTGLVVNQYDGNRSNIRVTGELLTDNGTVAQTQTVYCGNIISEMDLGNLDMNNIKQRLGNASGDKQSNISVKPGAKVSFMVVFSSLPNNMAEYRIQIAGSLPAEK